MDETINDISRPLKKSWIPVTLLPLDNYDKIIIHISAGKDSVASALKLKKMGVDFSKVEFWHQSVDGRGDSHVEFWDWPCTESYIESFAKFCGGVPVYYQWRRQGLYGELMRENALTADVYYESPDGSTVILPTRKGTKSTRRRFPSKNSKLSVRWCSTQKIDVKDRAMNNDPRLKGSKIKPIKILEITGERREEGGERKNYLEAEEGRSSTPARIVHHWRPVINETEKQIWGYFEEACLMAHPAYYLGFSRVSCMGCIYCSADHWAIIRYIAPERFERFVQKEKELGHTIDNKYSLLEQVKKGSLKKMPIGDKRLPGWIQLALSTIDVSDLHMKPFVLPCGANTGNSGGPE